MISLIGNDSSVDKKHNSAGNAYSLASTPACLAKNCRDNKVAVATIRTTFDINSRNIHHTLPAIVGGSTKALCGKEELRLNVAHGSHRDEGMMRPSHHYELQQ